MSTVTLATRTRSRRTIHFLRHLGEMTAAMFLGMGALAAVFAAAGGSLLDFRLAPPGGGGGRDGGRDDGPDGGVDAKTRPRLVERRRDVDRDGRAGADRPDLLLAWRAAG